MCDLNIRDVVLCVEQLYKLSWTIKGQKWPQFWVLDPFEGPGGLRYHFQGILTFCDPLNNLFKILWLKMACLYRCPHFVRHISCSNCTFWGHLDLWYIREIRFRPLPRPILPRRFLALPLPALPRSVKKKRPRPSLLLTQHGDSKARDVRHSCHLVGAADKSVTLLS